MVFIKDKLPPRLTESEIVKLLPLVRQGDEKARTRMIEGYMRLAAAITARYVLYYPRKSRELFAEALLALTIAIDRVATGVVCDTHDNVSAYVHKYIKYELLEFIKIDHTVRPPLNSEWLMEKLRQHGRDYLYWEFGCISYREDSKSEAYEKSESPNDGHDFMVPTQILKERRYQEFDFSEIELLESDFFTSREKIILKLRLDGQNNERIGRAIGYTEARVGQIIKEMENRVKKIVKGLI